MYVFVSFLGRNIKAKNMNQPYQLCLFILSTTTLFTGMLTQNIILKKIMHENAVDIPRMTETCFCTIARNLILIHVVSFLFWTDIKSTDEISHDWFKAQNHCFDRGLTIEKNRSNQPYWTGIYSRLTPWINILGQCLLFFFFYYQ